VSYLLIKDIAKLSRELNTSQVSLAEQEKINESLKSELSTMTQRIKRFENKMNEDNKDQDRSASEMASLRAEIDRLKAIGEQDAMEITNLKSVSEHLKKYKERATALKSEKKKNEDIMKEMHNELRMALETGESLHRQLSESQSEVEKIRSSADADVAAANKQVRLLEQKLESCLLELKQAKEAESRASDSSKSWQEKYLEERGLRRELGKKLMDLQGNIFVICRVRPILHDEGASCVEVIDSERLFVEDVPHNFDAVFGPQSTQDEVFAEVQPSAMSVLEGFNVCIFAYGQTGSGKTFTMEGGSSLALKGVNFRALSSLFDQAQVMPDVSFVFTVSMLEVYNENVKDLLGGSDDNLDIRLGNNGTGKLSVYVEGLRECEVTCMEQVEGLMAQGSRIRTVGSNNINEHSSRSHLVLSLKVAATKRGSSVTTFGKLNLVDLVSLLYTTICFIFS
jgi:hypothetical protein